MPAQVYQFGDGFRLDTGARQLFKGQTLKKLTPVNFDVLHRLIQKRGEVVPFAELKEIAWKEIKDFEQPLRTCIGEIRHALEDHNRTMVVNVQRRGYRFDGPVSVSHVGTLPECDVPQVSRDRDSATSIGPYASVSPLPFYYIERPGPLAKLRETVLSANERTVAVTALEGMGGIGKTELSRALCHDADVRAAFPDGIVWIEVGKESTSNLLDRMKKVARVLREDPKLYHTDNCVERYRSLLVNKALLIVLDNVWCDADVEPFLADAPSCRILFTTRDIRIAARLGAQNLTANLLDDGQARLMLATCSGRNHSELPSPAEQIIRECGYLPLGLREIGSSLRGKPDERWSDTLERLQKSQVPRLYAPTKVSLDVLGEENPEMRKRYLQLAVLLEDMAAPVPILQTLWGMDAITARDTMDELENRSLARREDGAIRLHDLQMDYVRSEYPDREALELIHDAFRLSAHVLAHDPAQFASQMVGRLLSLQRRESISGFLDSIRSGAPRPWLCPLKPLLTSPGETLIRTLDGHKDGVLGVTVSADGRRAISASLDKTLKIWDLNNGRELQTLRGHTEEVWGVAVSADGRLALSASPDETLKVWDVESARELQTLRGHTDSVMGVAVSADGRLAVSASHDHTLKVWDVERGLELRTLKGHTDWVGSVAVSADGRLAVSASHDKTLKVWDVESGRELRALKGHTDSVMGVALSADGRLAVSASHDHTLKVWDVERGLELRTLKGHTDWVGSVAVSADGRRAVSASTDLTLKVWDVDSGRELRTLAGHANSVTAVAVNRRQIISASLDETLKVWDMESAGKLRTLKGHNEKVVVISADGQRAVSASSDLTLKFWDVERGRELRTLKGQAKSIFHVAVSADRRRAIWASHDKTLKVWEVESGRELYTLAGHTRWVLGIAMSADGRLAVSASSDKTLKLWDVENGCELRTLTGHTDSVRGVAVSADGRLAVSASRDKTLKVWDLKNRRKPRTLTGHTDSVIGVAVSADGRLALSASDDETLKVWDLKNGRVMRSLQCHAGRISNVAVSADGKLGVVASHDKTLRVWDMETGNYLATFTCDAPVFCCTWGENIIVAGDQVGHVLFLTLER